MSKDHDADRAFLLTFGAVLGGLAAAAIVFGIIANVYSSNFTTGKSEQFQPADQHAERVQPVGQVNTAKESSTPTAAASKSSSAGRSGQQVVEQVCAACHTTKFMNAPQIGDKAEWAPRAKKGLDTLVEHALKGFGNMPPQGDSVSSQEGHAAIKYMVEEKTGIQLK